MLSPRARMPIALCLLSIFALSLTACTRSVSSRLPPPSPGQELASGEIFEEEGIAKKRQEWFWFQRTYPFDEVPEGARQRAWENRPPDFGQVEGIHPAAASMWESIGPKPTFARFINNWGKTSGRITTIAPSPADPQLILLGSALGGIWRSTDGGNSFVPVTDGHIDMAVGSIAFSKSNPAIVYAGMGDLVGFFGTGILKSTDAGLTWARVDTGLTGSNITAKIVVDPNDPNRVYLARYAVRVTTGATFSDGVYRSTDGGITWQRRLIGLPRDLVMAVNNPQILYAAMARTDMPGGVPAVYRSTDAGVTWNLLYQPSHQVLFDIQLAVTPANPQLIYLYSGGRTNGVFSARVEVSTDGGATFQFRNADGWDTGQFGYNTFVVAHPTNPDTVFLGARDVHRSTDGGRTFVNLNGNFPGVGSNLPFRPDQANAHADMHVLSISPHDPSTHFLGSDGGIYKSANNGNTYASLNETLSLVQFYGLTIHPTDSNTSYGGTQDNGWLRRRGGGTDDWDEIVTGDYRSILLDGANPTRIVSNYIGTTIFRFRDSGNTGDAVVGSNAIFGEPETGARVGFLAPMEKAYGNNSRIYFGTWRLFVSDNFGSNWTAPAGTFDLTKGAVPGQFTDILNVIGVATTTQNILYTGSALGRVMRTTDAGTTWTEVSAGLPTRTPTDIVVDNANPAIAYITFSGFGAGHVFKTTDMGATWTNISSNLPDIPTQALLIDPEDANVLYVGTDLGVFRSDTGGNSWTTFNNGLPPTVVTAFATNQNGEIQLATYGRGAYRLIKGDVPNPDLLPVINNATLVNKKFTLTGERFTTTPKVFANDVEITSRIKKASDISILLKGKMPVLNLRAGDNAIKVIDKDGRISLVFTLRL